MGGGGGEEKKKRKKPSSDTRRSWQWRQTYLAPDEKGKDRVRGEWSERVRGSDSVGWVAGGGGGGRM